MENVVKKPKLTIYIILSALLLIGAIAVAIYFLVGNKAEKKENRGTYVYTQCHEVTEV